MSTKRKIFLVLVLSAISLGSAGAWFGAGALYAAYLYLNPKLPEVDTLKDVRMQEPLRVYSRDGKLIGEFGESRRIPILVEDVPEPLIQAFLAAEDERFEEHPGVDYRGLIRAAVNLALTGEKTQGGSTITMQVARNFFLTRERTYTRKLNEIFLALKIERELSKDDILELYLNKIFFGKRALGVAVAAQVYYGKELHELDLAQFAMIAGLPKAPSRYNPIVNPDRAMTRRNYVLSRMYNLGFIGEDEYLAASGAPITAKTHDFEVEVEAPYVAEMARAEMVERYGEERAYTSGMRVYTTIDGKLQTAANLALRHGLIAYEERHGYRGPIKQVAVPAGTELIKITEPDEQDEAGELAIAPPLEQLEPEPQPDTQQAEATTEAEESEPEKPFYELPLEEANRLIADVTRFGNIFPGLILEVIQREVEANADAKKDQPTTIEIAKVFLGEGQYAELALDAAKWAAPFVSVNKKGKEPKSLNDVLEIGDVVWLRYDAQSVLHLAQSPEVEGALASLDPRSGAIISLVGGFDYYKSKFNRALQAKRQPGSGFKPFIYSAALENGFTTASIFNDAPVVFDDPALEGKWRPENYSSKFYGDTRLRHALIHSRNLVSIRLLIALGIKKAQAFARRFDFDDQALPRDLSLALGSGTLTPLELVSGFAVFANGGHKVKPFYIDRVEDTEGNILELANYDLACLQCFVDRIDPILLERNYTVQWPVPEVEKSEAGEETALDDTTAPAEPEVEQTAESLAVSDEIGVNFADDTEAAEDELNTISDEFEAELAYVEPKRLLTQAEQIVDPRVIYIMNSILRDVVKMGTGRRALALGRNDIAGKTGTTNDELDAWFNGFNHKYVTSVWVGYDSLQTLGRGEQGGVSALPIWLEYMRTALENVPEELPKQPEGLVSIRIDAKTGLLASTTTSESLFELFRVENVPTERSEEAGVAIDGGEDGIEIGTTVTEELF